MSQDTVIRAITKDGAFRAITLDCTRTVREAVEAQQLNGEHAALFGDLLASSVLVRETMAPDQRVQVFIKPQGGNASMIADSHPEGLTRGYVNEPAREHTWRFGDETLMQVVRVLPRGRLSQGLITTVDSDDPVSASLASYFLNSEQVSSAVGVATLLDERGHVLYCGGYIIQLLPELYEDALRLMLERLEGMPPFPQVLARHGADAAAMMSELFGGFEHVILEQSPVLWACQCSEERLLGAIATMSREDILEVVAEGGAMEITCDYCRKHYVIPTEQVRALLDVT